MTPLLHSIENMDKVLATSGKPARIVQVTIAESKYEALREDAVNREVSLDAFCGDILGMRAITGGYWL